ncbi:unnamed protein product [Phytophthora lilii]|uniref:Unnamed protein product n=1 Tax=Phytophthora lilii TaxID=2077276 RepID=A0A9W6T9A2_9STRA|nr:unnamed protein product [Phytophthora lilii]
MQVISTLAAASVALGAAATNANTEHVQRQLILGGEEVAVGAKTYAVGIRPTVDSDNFCGGSLISPTHVLTTATCSQGDIAVAAVGSHYINGTSDGEQIRIVSGQRHPQYNTTSGSYDFAVLTLEKPSKFAPVKLPAANDSDIIPGMWAKVMGWGDTSFPNGTTSYELLSVGVQVWDNNDCLPVFVIDDTMVCAGGVAGKDACNGDTGAPLVKEKGRGDADDVVIGVSSWGHGCGNDGVPGVYSRVSAAVEWINSVTKSLTPLEGQQLPIANLTKTGI